MLMVLGCVLLIFTGLPAVLVTLGHLLSYGLLWVISKFARIPDDFDEMERCADTRPAEGHV